MRRRLKKKVKIFAFIVIIAIITFILLPSNKITYKDKEGKNEGEKEVEVDNTLYYECLKKPFTEEELTTELNEEMNSINTLIEDNKYRVSVKYEDLTTGFTYNYDENKVYYGASLIKLVDAIYLINKAINGEINLDTETVTYTKNYVKASSKGMETRTLGEDVSLRDLITYAITVSDNSAHHMLIDYIGFNNLQTYGRSLGAKVILQGTDKFGHQTASDTNIYLKEAYKIITENDEYGPFLKEIMGNDYRNSYNTDDIKIYHKYGSWDANYHDIGLNLDIEYPYAISILTLHEGGNYKEVVQNIHEEIINLHNSFHNNRLSVCESLKK